jgi:hypothetical protein
MAYEALAEIGVNSLWGYMDFSLGINNHQTKKENNDER